MRDQQPNLNSAHTEIQALLSRIESTHGGRAWELFERLEQLPQGYRAGVEAFREGLKSDNYIVQLASAKNIVRLSGSEAWVVPDLREFLHRDHQDLFSASVGIYSLQLVQTCEAAGCIAEFCRCVLTEQMPLQTKMSLVMYCLHSLVAMGGVALAERGGISGSNQLLPT